MTPAERTKQTKLLQLDQVITSPRSWIPKSAVTTNHGWQPFQVSMLHGILKPGSAHPFPWNSANHELSPSVLDQASVPPFRGMSLEWHLTVREESFSQHLLTHARNNSSSSGQWSKKKKSNEMNATENVAGSVPSTSLTTAALASSCLTCTLHRSELQVCFAGLFWGMFRGSVLPKWNFRALFEVVKKNTNLYSIQGPKNGNHPCELNHKNSCECDNDLRNCKQIAA